MSNKAMSVHAKGEELILAIPSEIVDQCEIPEGVTIFTEEDTEAVLLNLDLLDGAMVVDYRKNLEGNPKFRQLIPYILIEHDGMYFSASRTVEGGDTRLHGKTIVGFGGHSNFYNTDGSTILPFKGDVSKYDETYYNSYTHISNCRANIIDQISFNARREFDEELSITSDAKDIDLTGTFQILGFINDTSTEVSKDHLGIYIKVSVPSRCVDVAEKSVLVNSGFRSISELLEYNLESWSKLVLEALDSPSWV